MARLSGLQREVLSLYRSCLREIRKKPVVGRMSLPPIIHELKLMFSRNPEETSWPLPGRRQFGKTAEFPYWTDTQIRQNRIPNACRRKQEGLHGCRVSPSKRPSTAGNVFFAGHPQHPTINRPLNVQYHAFCTIRFCTYTIPLSSSSLSFLLSSGAFARFRFQKSRARRNVPE